MVTLWLPDDGDGMVDVPMPVTAPHRRGARTNLINSLRGRAASRDEVLAVVSDVARAGIVAEAASLVVREWDFRDGVACEVDYSVADAARIVVDALMPVRRPSSYEGMRKLIGQVTVPSDHGSRAVWCESRNEAHCYRALLMTGTVAAMATQPMRIEWPLPSGRSRSHIPDALIERVDGTVALVDVTTADRACDPWLRAIHCLTAHTCEALGWDYTVVTEPTKQRQMNVAALWACRTAAPEASRRWRTIAREFDDGLQVEIAARRLDPDRGWAALLHLIATGVLTIDLDAPIRPWSEVRRGARIEATV